MRLARNANLALLYVHITPRDQVTSVEVTSRRADRGSPAPLQLLAAFTVIGVSGVIVSAVAPVAVVAVAPVSVAVVAAAVAALAVPVPAVALAAPGALAAVPAAAAAPTAPAARPAAPAPAHAAHAVRLGRRSLHVHLQTHPRSN